MTIRCRFDITWTVTRDQFAGAWFSIEDHLALARELLLGCFRPYHPEARFQVNPVSARRDEIRILWDVDLDAVPGAWHSPEDHIRFLQARMRDGFAQYDAALEVQVWRRADLAEAVDHAEILAFHGSDTRRDDYPVFRPEPHADWEEANEVWLQDGTWFWAVSDESPSAFDPAISRGPSAGPVPTAIYTPWDPDYRARLKAAAERAAVRDHAASNAA